MALLSPVIWMWMLSFDPQPSADGYAMEGKRWKEQQIHQIQHPKVGWLQNSSGSRKGRGLKLGLWESSPKFLGAKSELGVSMYWGGEGKSWETVRLVRSSGKKRLLWGS